MATENSTRQKFQIIAATIAHDNNLLNITQLCKIAGVSHSGYYNWYRTTIKNALIRDEQDKKDFELILKAYQKRGYKKGRRSIHMTLLHSGILMNTKKIRRLMAKFNLSCPIRKPNPYKKMARATKENATKSNLVKRNFESYGPRIVLLTDITYLFYNGKKAYLSVVKDAFTKEILSYVLSQSLEIDFVLETIRILVKKHGISLCTDTVIHSDQGVHYTSIKFQELVANKQLRQSMSRRGNCWDNAPQESFFGHMKDELDVSKCQSYEQLLTAVNDYMDYYNKERYQWQLAKLSPNQYYQFVKTGNYPLERFLETPELPVWHSVGEVETSTQADKPLQNEYHNPSG